MIDSSWWLFFNIFLLLALSLDLYFSEKFKQISFKQSLVQCGLWGISAILFSIFLLFSLDKHHASEFFAGYLVELSLSIDNLFVFVLLFRYFKIENSHQRHLILRWGIFGALVLRLICIVSGISLINTFHWIFYLLGVFLVYSGYMLLKHASSQNQISGVISVVEKIKKYLPVVITNENIFFVRKQKKIYITQLFLALCAIECADLVFALDSIPAILGITLNSFIVYTSNAFAILGLRALFFVIDTLIQAFPYLHKGISYVLMFIGVKMIISDYVHIPPFLSLGIIALILLPCLFIHKGNHT